MLSPPKIGASEPDWAAIRWALGQIESGDRDSAIGQAGEVSRYQIRPELWRQLAPRLNPRNPDQAWAVARRELGSRMARARLPRDQYARACAIYLLWNAPEALARADYDPARVNATLRDRATRFANLATDFPRRGLTVRQKP